MSEFDWQKFLIGFFASYAVLMMIANLCLFESRNWWRKQAQDCLQGWKDALRSGEREGVKPKP